MTVIIENVFIYPKTIDKSQFKANIKIAEPITYDSLGRTIHRRTIHLPLLPFTPLNLFFSKNV